MLFLICKCKHPIKAKLLKGWTQEFCKICGGAWNYKTGK